MGKKDSPKKRFLTKKKLFVFVLLLAIIAVLFFSPKGTWDIGIFLPTSMTSKDEGEKVKPTEKIVQALDMRFIDKKLHIGSWPPCVTEDELKKLVEKIRMKYPDKEILITYLEDGKDPYRRKHFALKILKESGFTIKHQTEGSNE